MNANRLLPLALAAITSAQAETFWLVTRMLPQPYNPHPQAEKQLIRSNAHGGIWLVDDTPWNPLPPDWPNRELITLSNLVHAWTNQVPIPEEKPVVIYKTWPQKNYYNTNLMTPGIGLMIRSWEKDHPGISTNFTAEQLALTNPPPAATPWHRRTLRLPPHINKGSPTYEEDLQRWKDQNFPKKGSGGGDYEYPGVSWYAMEVTVWKATNCVVNDFGKTDNVPPSRVTWRRYPHPPPNTDFDTVTATNYSGTFSIVSEHPLSQLFLRYPDVSVKDGPWQAGFTEFYGEFCSEYTFSKSNALIMPAEKVAANWSLTYDAYSPTNCEHSLDGAFSFSTATLAYSLVPNPMLTRPPRVLMSPGNLGPPPGMGPPQGKSVQAFARGFTSVHVYYSTNLQDWFWLTNGSTDETGLFLMDIVHDDDPAGFVRLDVNSEE